MLSSIQDKLKTWAAQNRKAARRRFPESPPKRLSLRLLLLAVLAPAAFATMPLHTAAAACLIDTTQADFQAGVATDCDLASSPGEIVLAEPVTINQQNQTLGTSGVGITTTTWGGQTFTPSATGELVSVDINLFCSGCTGSTPDLTLSLRATSGGLPTGADIASATVSGFSDASSAFHTATFSSRPTLTSGTQYALVIRATANPAPGTYALTRSGSSTSGSDVYAGGTRIAGASSGTVWSIPLTGGTSTDAGFIVHMRAGFAASGDIISGLKDAAPPAGTTVFWNTLSWNAAAPAGTSVQFQIAASTDASGPFNFVGPDGTAASYFTTSGASLAQFNGHRYLQYRAYLSTADATLTPTLSDVSVCFINASVPSVTGIAPAAGAGGSEVTITGTGLIGATSVTFGSVAAAAFTVVDDTTVTTNAPTQPAGVVDVVVTTPAGSSAIVPADQFTYLPAPTVAAIAPNTGLVAGGTAITITGSEFVSGATVTIGGASATDINVASATTITATAPAHPAGRVDVAVTTPGGTGTGTQLYDYITPLALASTASATLQVGQDYSQANNASGGTPPYVYTLASGSLPAGTSLNASTGVVSGLLTNAGSFSYSIRASDTSLTAQIATRPTSGNITKAGTTITLTSSASPGSHGDTITLTANVTSQSGGSISGTVTFHDGPAVLGTGSLAGGVASYGTSSLAAGGHSLTASYDGGANYAASTSSPLLQTVVQSCADAFASATAIAGVTGTAVGSTAAATAESGEPAHAGAPASHSVWCAWTAPASGTVSLDTSGSLFDTTLAVYTGDAPGSLTLIAQNDNIAPNISHSRLGFAAIAGTTYRIVVDGRDGASGSYLLNWTQTPSTPTLVAAVLPTSRSVLTGTPATAFSTVINGGSASATGCGITLPPGFPATFAFQTTNATDNMPSGNVDAPVDIAPGAAQTFVTTVTPTVDLAAADIALVFGCANTQPVRSVTALNTFSLSAAATATPDLVAIGATPSQDGVLRIPAGSYGALAAAAINIGAAGDITARLDDNGADLPLAVTLCRTDPTTGACLTAPAASVTATLATGEIATYTAFVRATGAVALAPADSRMILRFITPDGVTRGATSVAVMTTGVE